MTPEKAMKVAANHLVNHQVVQEFTVWAKEKDKDKIEHGNNGEIVALPYLWKTNLHEKEPVSTSVFLNGVYYKGNIVAPTTNGGNNRCLSLISSKDGKILWAWDDRFQPETEYADIKYYHQYENLFTYHVGGRFYCINLDNGTTHWRIQRDKSFDHRITPFFEQYYFTYTFNTNNDGYEEMIAFKGDIQTGNISEYLTANFIYDHPDCVRAIVYVNQVPNHENLLLVAYAENLPNWVTRAYLGLYDIDSKEWKWDKIEANPPRKANNFWQPPTIISNKIYASIANKIVCHDLITGKQLWSKSFTNDFMFSGFIIEGDKLIGTHEDGYTFCLDLETGSALWNVKTAGSCTPKSYLNGIAYFVGGSVPKLFGIEASTGKIVWCVDAPRLKDGKQGEIFYSVYTLPAENGEPAKVIALTNLNAYCFKAYR
jgi:outer membrane protein assembly factor BamB